MQGDGVKPGGGYQPRSNSGQGAPPQGESVLAWMGPCGHSKPQADSQLHGMCVFCYRDRSAKAHAELKAARQALEEIAAFPSGGLMLPGSPSADRHKMIHIARTALARKGDG